MRNNTQRIYERLSRGEFLSVDSVDTSVRHLYEDIEENLEDYIEYFKEIGLRLESGNGYFYFSRIGEGRQTVEQKLDSFSKWLDYLDFLKCYNQSFTAGYQFRKSHLIEQISLDIELKEKANHLFKKYGVASNVEIINKLLQEMLNMGFAECISELDQTYKVTSAFHYAEELVGIIQIANEDEIPTHQAYIIECQRLFILKGTSSILTIKESRKGNVRRLHSVVFAYGLVPPFSVFL